MLVDNFPHKFKKAVEKRFTESDPPVFIFCKWKLLGGHFCSLVVPDRIDYLFRLYGEESCWEV